MIPFFVVDRPVSLEILKGFFAESLNLSFGILTHAFTSPNFRKRFRNFPFETPLKYVKVDDLGKVDRKLSKNILKFADSGIFLQKEVSYRELFQIYEELSADYGVIVDHLYDREKTLQSAERALSVYEKGNWSFRLVGVAQGKTVEDYLVCYEGLKKLGYKYIALGGLLRRNGKSNYVRLSCEEFLRELLSSVVKEFSPEWIFTFGIYSPKRHSLLESFGVWGADYKGWLFEYEEDYSFAPSYLESLKIPASKKKELIELFRIYSEKKKNRLLYYSKEKKEKEELLRLRKELEEKLKEEGLSLQWFRFKRVRENLKKHFSTLNGKSES
jgi:hypothetical protein